MQTPIRTDKFDKNVGWMPFHQHLHLTHKPQELEFLGIIHTMHDKKEILKKQSPVERHFITKEAVYIRGLVNSGKERRIIEKRAG